MPMITASTGRILQVRREPRGTALAKHHHLANAGAHAVHGDDRVRTGAELRRDPCRPPVAVAAAEVCAAHGWIFLGRDDRAFDSCEEHKR